VEIHEVWRFAGGRPAGGYPTLRSAYIDALASIPGADATAALLEVLDLTSSVEETFQIAWALDERGEGRWVAVSLERAAAERNATAQPVQEALVALAARADPAGTAAQVLALAPRGEDPRDPKILAGALEGLPLAVAIETARRVLDDRTVTATARDRHLESLFEREEPEVLEHVRERIRAEPPDRRIAVAFAALRSGTFQRDVVARDVAQARGDAAEALRLRERYARRLDEVTRLVETALDEVSAEDPRARNLRRSLDRHREAMPE
jgi:hypothetical protein